MVVLAIGCGDAKRPVTISNAGSSGAPPSGGGDGAGTSRAGGQSGSLSGDATGNGGSSEVAENGGAGRQGAGADSSDAGVAGVDQGSAGGDGGAGASGVPFGCMPNAAVCPAEPPENTAACAQSMADAGIFCAYGSCTQACVCNGAQTGSAPSFAWLYFPIGM